MDRTHVLQGEQVNLTFKLYTRVSIVNYAVEKNPTMTGFWGRMWRSRRTSSSRPRPSTASSTGSGVIKRMALFPTQSGTLRDQPDGAADDRAGAVPRSADPFDSFFRDPFGRNVNHAVRSNGDHHHRRSASGGRPAGLPGAVGQFAMSTTVDKKTTRTNEPVSLKITISGTGNIKLLESPVPEIPPDFEQYPPKVTDKINRGQRASPGARRSSIC